MQTTTCTQFAQLGVIVTFLSACAPAHYTDLSSPPVPPPASFVHHAASENIELFWNCSQPSSEVIRVTGAARNSGQQEVRSVELTARSLLKGEVPLLKTAEALPEIILYAHDPSPFQIDLPLEKAPTQIQVSAVYRLTPDVSAPNSAGPQRALLVADACAPTQNLNTLYNK
jgi:hypothetical protein